MKLEEQLARIAEEHGLASLTITAFADHGHGPWINVDVQSVSHAVRFLGNARVDEGGLVPAITQAIHNLHTKIAARRDELAPLADAEGAEA